MGENLLGEWVGWFGRVCFGVRLLGYELRVWIVYEDVVRGVDLVRENERR